MTLAKTNTELSTSQVDDITNEILNIYGEETPVEIDVNYQVTGSFIVDPVTTDPETIKEGISEALDIPLKDIFVTVDPETGKVDYIINHDDYSEAEITKETISNEAFEDIVDSHIDDATIDTTIVNEDIITEVLILNATVADIDLDEANEESKQYFLDDGWTVNQESKRKNGK